jgi:LuxR family transcriptional regulator, maltose regulon positive regulatory protein
VTGSLLETKFYLPKRSTGLVPRPHLTDRVGRGIRTKLTLVSAPAGFGKSTLLADSLAVAATDGSVTAWLSLEPSDNDPVVFWAQVIAALRTVAPEVGASSLSLLETPGTAIEAALAPLLNDLNAFPSEVVLVLDDYHVIEAQDIQVGMSFMLEHLPTQVHVVIATRADPSLPLARLRARGELVEIRAADLRFTPDEATAYFNGVMSLGLTAGDVATLESRTEGWIAALQLAGLSMQGREDIAGFIADFAGDDRYVVDYLVEEVWQRQPDHVRAFLLQTSILSRMTGSLCDAVTGHEGGRATLEALDRGNLFIIPLDDRRRWYRYHHLFADVLQARLLDVQPALGTELHRRATEWYAQEGELAEAISHAVAGKDLARAADLIELGIPALSRDRQESTLRRWLEALPDDVIRTRPVLSDGYAGSILVRGETDGVEERLRDAERWLDAIVAAPDGRPPGMIVVDETAFRDLPASVAIHRAGQARILGDLPGTVAHARRALDLVQEDQYLSRGASAALLGLSAWTLGDLDSAHLGYVEAMANLEKAGYLADVLGCAVTLADIEIAQGRLHEAKRTYERALELSIGHGVPPLRGTADMHVALSALARERDDLPSAVEHLRAAAELGEENGLPQNSYRSRLALARVRQTERDFDGAIELLREAERVYANDFSPDIRPIGAVMARVWIAAGRIAEASAWVRASGLSTADGLSYVREFEHVTLARVLLAEGTRDRSGERIAEVLVFLARLLAAAMDGNRIGSVIDILIVQALALHASGDPTAALSALARAVDLAEPEGYVRAFIDEGPPMTALLKLAAKRSNSSSYVRRLLAAVPAPEGRAPIDQPLIEPLSERELDVLRLLESDLDGPDIARELSVSLATVRTHTRNIYAKLGVNNRSAAVRRGAELGLLARTRGSRPTA